MKNFLGICLLAFHFSVSGQEVQIESNFQTQAVRLGCRYSEDVWSYVTATMGEGAAVDKEQVTPVSDEDNRFYIQYADGSYLIVVEYDTRGSAPDNFMCIVEKGDKATAPQALVKPIRSLPSDFLPKSPHHGRSLEQAKARFLFNNV